MNETIMRKMFFLTALAASVLLSCPVAMAEKYTREELDMAVRTAFRKTDLQWENLKGNVVKVQTQSLPFRYAYGEYTLSSGSVYRDNDEMMVFGKDSNLLMSLRWGSARPEKILFYHYDGKGRRSSVDSYDVWYNTVRSTPESTMEYDWSIESELSDHDEFVKKYGYDRSLRHSVYEYDGNGRLKTVITREDEEPESEGARDIFRYQSDGSLKMTKYDKSGGETMVFSVSPDGKEETRSTGYISTAIWRDGDGRMVSLGAVGGGYNGSASELRYYRYNENGDLFLVTRDVSLTEQHKVIPWLEAKSDIGAFTYYEYEYDDHGNWITRKTFEHLSMDNEVSLKKWEQRTITYAEGSRVSGEEYVAGLFKKKEEVTVKWDQLKTAQEEKARMRREHPTVTFDGDLGEAILSAVRPKLPRVSLLKALSSVDGHLTILMSVSAQGKVLNAQNSSGYYYSNERADLIRDEAIKAAKALDGDSRWVEGYEGQKFIIEIHYFATGEVTVHEVSQVSLDMEDIVSQYRPE